MRKILISKRGEFKCKVDANLFRGKAVKKLASVIQKSSDGKPEENSVIVSEKSFKKAI